MGGGDEGTTGEMDLESRSNRHGTGVGSSHHEIMTSAASICNEWEKSKKNMNAVGRGLQRHHQWE